MNELINRFRLLFDQLSTEEAEVQKVKQSTEYQELESQIQNLLEKKSEMLPKGIAYEQYADCKTQIMREMKGTNTYEVEGIVCSFTEKKEVDQNMVLEAIGGDFGIFQELASISQVKLKDFAKTQPGMKKPLMNCIRIVSKELKDIRLEK